MTAGQGMLSIHEKDGAIVFKIHVQPKASRNQVAGLHGDALKIRLTAPPVDGKANKALCRFLAECLDLAASDVEIVSGHTAKAKTIAVQPGGKALTGPQAEDLKNRIAALAAC